MPMNNHDTSLAIVAVLIFGMVLLGFFTFLCSMSERPQVQIQPQSNMIQVDRELVRIALERFTR